MTESEKNKACALVAQMMFDIAEIDINDGLPMNRVQLDALITAHSVLSVALFGVHSWEGAVPFLREIMEDDDLEVDQFILDAPMAEYHGGTEA